MTVDELRAAVRDELSNHVPARLVSVEAAAAALGIARTSCYDLISTGRLRSVTVGRRRLVPVQALDEFVQNALEGAA